MQRFFLYLIEILCGIVVLAVLGGGAVMWRLGREPISVARLIPDIEAALADAAPGMHIKIDAVHISSNERYRAITLALNGIHVANAQNQVVGTLREVRLGFNWRNITHWTYTPVAVAVINPVIELTRFDDGHVGFNLQEAEDGEKHAVSFNTLSDMLARAPQHLNHITVSNAVMRYRDEQGNVLLRGTGGTLDFHRRDNMIGGMVSLNLKTRDFEQRIQGTINTDIEQHQTHLSVGLRNLQLEQVRLFTGSIPADLQLDMPVDVLLTATIDDHLRLAEIGLEATGKAGSVVYPPYAVEPVPLKDLLLSGRYLLLDKKLVIDKLALGLRDAGLVASGDVTWRANADDVAKTDTHIALKAAATNVPLNDLHEYWPQVLAPHAQAWVTTRILDGTATRANVDLALTLSPEHHATIERMGGGIDFTGASVNYLPPMPVVRNVNGHADFDKDNFNIATTSGDLFDTRTTRGDIRISSMRHDAQIAIDLDMAGPVRDALNTIAAPPLSYMQKMGMSPEQFSGDAKTNLKLAFPLIQHLQLAQVEMQTKATLTNVTARHVVKDLDATGKALDVAVDTHGLTLDGDVVIENAPAHIKWQEFFGHDVAQPTVLDVTGGITPAVLTGLRLPIASYFMGSAQTTAHVTQSHDKTIHVTAKADLARANITVPEIGVAKPVGVPGRLSLDLDVVKGASTTLSDVNAAWAGFALAKGMFRWDGSGALQSARVKNVVAGRTRASIAMTPSKNNRTRVVVQGDTLDLSRFWSDRRRGGKDGPDDRILDITLRGRTVYLDDKLPFHDMKADLGLRGNVLLNADISATAGKDASLVLRQVVTRDKGRELYIRANNAGRIMSALDYADSVYGGTLVVTGKSAADHPERINGVLTLEDFSMIKAPLLARLLNALSPGGLLNLLNENGLTFSRLKTSFSLADKNTITLTDGKMNGASLGLNFRGAVRGDSKELDLRGTIIPIQGINKFVARVPILGPILTGLRGEGIIAATYTITGPADDPRVFVNPLSALAPGILRSLLFESGD